MEAPDPTREAVDRVVEQLTRSESLKVVDTYPMLIRAGTNWRDYSFEWEPFRDLAGAMTPLEDAQPIVLVSETSEGGEPYWASPKEPTPHLRLHVNPTHGVVDVIEQWIGQARFMSDRDYEAGFFLENLGLKPRDVSADVREFLGLEADRHEDAKQDVDPKQTVVTRTPDSFTVDVERLPLSATMKAVQERVGESAVTATVIAEALRDRHPEYGGARFASVDFHHPLTSELQPFDGWWARASHLLDPERVASSRHQVLNGRLFLLALATLDPGVRSVFDGDADLRRALFGEIDESAIEPDSELDRVYRHLIRAPDTSSDGTGDHINLQAGYLTDAPDGDDQLGIEGEVKAMCEVLTDPKVKPPLAVGLFGSWGSGKSFFMGKMRERIHELTEGESARRPSKVVQIRFNAWHYADTSLWASLAVEIFERLADPEPVGREERARWLERHGDLNRAKRRGLIENLETYREAQAALEAERSRLEEERTRLVAERNKVAAARAKVIEDAKLPDVIAQLARDEELKEKLDEVQAELGFKPAMSELATLASELRTASGHVTHVWRLMKRKGLVVVLAAAFFLLAMLSLTLALSGTWDLLSGVATSAGSIVALVVAAVQHVLPAVKKVNIGLGHVQDALQRANTARSELANERAEKERALEVELENHLQMMQETTRSISEVDRKIATVLSEVQSLSVGRSLYDFLADRAAGYKKHQGVVGMLHRDFRLLDAQFRALAREAEEREQAGAGATPDTGEEGERLPAIERVILYVDDLDRCPPEKVLEVLEAVHLLLALELFIVVVGVDPRWLDRSLRHQYKELSTADDIRTDPYLQAMPTEYLEKIFQIAFTLPAMEPAAYAQLIESLAKSDDEVSEEEHEPDEAGAPEPQKPKPTLKRRARSRNTLGGDTIPSRSVLRVEEGSAAEGGATPALGLQDEEVEFAQRLADLVDTPRSAKRLMNAYRLIRSTRSEGSRVFLGDADTPGEFQAVLTLLAVTAGFPTLADRVLARLQMEGRSDDPLQTWKAFVEALQPGSDDEEHGPYFPEDLRDLTEADEVRVHEEAAWRNLAQALLHNTGANELTGLEPYVRWASSVARFSFTVQ